MQGRRIRVAVAVALVGLTAAAGPVGAAAKKKATKKVSTTTKKATPTTKAGAASTVSTAAPKSQASSASGTLRMAQFTDNPTFDPIKVNNAVAPAINTIYDTLMRRDAKGNPAPGLALSATQPDPRTWRFALRPGVKFTDGTPWDATAAKYNIDRASSYVANQQASVFFGLTGVQVVDPLTVDVKFSKGNPAFPFEMGGIAGAMVSPNATSLDRAPVGTGGWIFDRGASQEGVKYVFRANPDYWDKANQHFAKVELYPIPDNGARLNALKTGQVDVIDVVVPAQYDDARGAGLKVLRKDDTTSLFLIGDRKGQLVPALSNLKVRQAMQYAFNQEAYVKAVYNGVGIVDNSIFDPGAPFYNKENSRRFPYDKARAKQLLAEAGYPDGFDMSVPVFSTVQAVTEGFATMLADVGIRVKLVPITPGTAAAEFRKKNFPVQYYPLVSGHPYSDWAALASAISPWNPFGIDNSIIDSLADRALKATSFAEQKKAFSQMEQAMQDEGMVVVMGHTATITAMRKDAQGSPYTYAGERGVRPYLIDFPAS